jgi:phosphinothricin acetyltransferase
MEAVVRLATETDAAQLAAIYAPSVLDGAVSFELEPPDAAERARRVRAAAALAAGLPFARA